MSIEGDCLNDAGFPYYWSHDDIAKLLSPEERVIYRHYVKQYRFPGFEIVTCPRYRSTRNMTSVCGADILVSLETIRTQGRGRVLMTCTQACHQKSCYHCHRRVANQSNHCVYCVRTNERFDPNANNHYFYRQDATSDQLFYRNSELEPDVIVNQLQEIVSSNNSGYVRCFRCRTKLHKTEQCNALSHCRTEICYACGRSGTAAEGLGNSHWDPTGRTGCPRFNHHRFWNRIAGCNYQCQEGECHSHTIGDCTVPEHQTGIRNMIDIRKKARVYHALFSLLPETLENILPILEENDAIRPYLPSAWGTDYREYLPEITQYHDDESSDDSDDSDGDGDG
jgi:hypothetical protein